MPWPTLVHSTNTLRTRRRTLLAAQAGRVQQEFMHQFSISVQSSASTTDVTLADASSWLVVSVTVGIYGKDARGISAAI